MCWDSSEWISIRIPGEIAQEKTQMYVVLDENKGDKGENRGKKRIISKEQSLVFIHVFKVSQENGAMVKSEKKPPERWD